MPRGADPPVTAAVLRKRAALARRLARDIPNEADCQTLNRIADELETEAAELERGTDR